MGVLVGKPAPDFTVPAVLGDGSIVDEFTLSEAIKGKYELCSSTRWIHLASGADSVIH